MGEPTVIKFPFREVAAMMVRQQGIKDGRWGIYVKFGIGAVNMGPADDSLVPTAIVPLLELGLQRVEGGPTALSVDAAEVWARESVAPNTP